MARCPDRNGRPTARAHAFVHKNRACQVYVYIYTYIYLYTCTCAYAGRGIKSSSIMFYCRVVFTPVIFYISWDETKKDILFHEHYDPQGINILEWPSWPSCSLFFYFFASPFSVTLSGVTTSYCVSHWFLLCDFANSRAAYDAARSSPRFFVYSSLIYIFYGSQVHSSCVFA